MSLNNNLQASNLLQQLPRINGTVKVLQVFNKGQACGWLGREEAPGDMGYWFHYASGNINQYPICALMPANRTMYRWHSLFPVFEQHLPCTAGCDFLQTLYPNSTLGPLELLSLIGADTLGPLSFANPDAPYVRPRSWISDGELTQRDLHQLGNAAAPLLRTLNGNGECAALIYADRSISLPSAVAWRSTEHETRQWLKELPLQHNTIRHGQRICWAQRTDLNIDGLRTSWESTHSRLGLSRADFDRLKRDERRWRWVNAELQHLRLG